MIRLLAKETGIPARQIEATVRLLDEGATVPFLARYRKEATGSLDEVAITAIRDRISQLRELDKRREAVLKSIKDQNKLTDELKDKIMAAQTLAVLEDIYLPYKPKRRTRATIAKEKGLEPLAELIIAQKDGVNPQEEAEVYVDPGKKIDLVEEALAGARDIIAEWINENSEARARMRKLFWDRGQCRTKVIRGKEGEGIKFKDYFDYEEPVAKAAAHRILAMRRGEKEGILTLRVLPPEEEAFRILEEFFLKGPNACSEQVRLAIEDSYKRLLSLSIETEIRLAAKEKADTEAIKVFAQNLRQLLMAPPLGAKNILAIDPGYRTGCKVCVLDRQGKLLDTDTVYLTDSQEKRQAAEQKLREHVRRYGTEVIAVGNGTASREAERFVRALKFERDIPVVVVNESGASIYSASEVARREFPDYDITVRGAVSIGRRLMDPLAELVKIDPKSIGVGQYQHDVDQNKLKQSLDDVVVSCVNLVGVEINSASGELLSYVSGVGPALARTIVEYRNKNGAFRNRNEFAGVSGFGPKAFEQAAGFLRIYGAENPLDASGVHPESYRLVEAMARDCQCAIKDLMAEERLRKKIDLPRYVSDTAGLPTLTDILNELAKPGRDPREHFEVFQFADGIEKPEDLVPGMSVPGIVTNITDFGVFVDIGVHLDGLVHVSQLSDKFVKHPSDVMKVGQQVKVTVLEVDLERKRIALSMKKHPQVAASRSASKN